MNTDTHGFEDLISVHPRLSVERIPARVVLTLLTVYKLAVSPFLPPACRFEPTCSEYAREAVGKYGAISGTWMAVKRILRCQPFCKGGHDPVK